MSFDPIDASPADIDAMDFDPIATSDEAAIAVADEGPSEYTPHHETQADVDEMFADAAFERIDKEAAEESKVNDALAHMKPKERRALFS